MKRATRSVVIGIIEEELLSVARRLYAIQSGPKSLSKAKRIGKNERMTLKIRIGRKKPK